MCHLTAVAVRCGYAHFCLSTHLPRWCFLEGLRSSWAAWGPSFGLHPRPARNTPWLLTSWITGCLYGLWGGSGSALVMSPQGYASCKQANAVSTQDCRPHPAHCCEPSQVQWVQMPGLASSTSALMWTLGARSRHSGRGYMCQTGRVPRASFRPGREVTGLQGQISKPNLVGREVTAQEVVWAHARQEVPGSPASIKSRFLRRGQLGDSETMGTAWAGRPKWGAEELRGMGVRSGGLPKWPGTPPSFCGVGTAVRAQRSGHRHTLVNETWVTLTLLSSGLKPHCRKPQTQDRMSSCHKVLALGRPVLLPRAATHLSMLRAAWFSHPKSRTQTGRTGAGPPEQQFQLGACRKRNN